MGMRAMVYAALTCDSLWWFSQYSVELRIRRRWGKKWGIPTMNPAGMEGS